jgi:hypothetical protein
MSDYTTLYNIAHKQNISLQNTINQFNDIYSTDDVKYTHKQKNTNWYNALNKLLLLIYFVLLATFVIFIFISNKITVWFGFLALFLLLFPFFCVKIEMYFWNICKYVCGIFMGVPASSSQNPM